MNEKVEAWAEACYKYKHRWIAYLTSLYGTQFIREFGSPARIMVGTPEQVYNYIGHYNRCRVTHAFISVNAYEGTVAAPTRSRQKIMPDYKSVIPTRAFFDFDFETKRKEGTGKTLHDAHMDALSYFDELVPAAPWKVQLRFSGSKGFAVEIFHKFAYYEQIEALSAAAREKHPLIDITTDRARIYRIPYTIHPSSMRQCIPISPNWSTEQVLTESERYRPPPVVGP